MSIAFLEGAEYEAATCQGEPEETAMTIDYAERYDDERLAQGNDDVVFEMRDELIAAIAELRSTIAAQHDTAEEQATLIAQQIELLDEKNKRIAELEAALELIRQSREYRTNLLLTSMDKSSVRIAELEAQLAAALATIERAS